MFQRARAYDLGARGVEDVARAARGVEGNEEQRSAAVDAIVTDADQIAAYHRHRTLDRVETDKVRSTSQLRLQRHIRPLRHLQTQNQPIADDTQSDIGVEIAADFCAVCHANSDPKSARKLGAENGRRLERCSIPIG